MVARSYDEEEQDRCVIWAAAEDDRSAFVVRCVVVACCFLACCLPPVLGEDERGGRWLLCAQPRRGLAVVRPPARRAWGQPKIAAMCQNHGGYLIRLFKT